MQIRIAKNNIIKDIEDKFNAVYPYLKLEFTKSYSLKTNPAYKREKVNSSLPIYKLGIENENIIINISSNKTVAELEEDLHDMLGLNTSVLRKSGVLWVTTSLTNAWTLEQQNREGEQLSAYYDRPSLPEGNDDAST